MSPGETVFAGTAHLTRDGQLLIDGRPFPWYLSADGITVHVGRNDATRVTVDILVLGEVTVERTVLDG